MDRVILHVDMNNCFASIEIADHPEWRGKPLAVCGSTEDRHGIVLAKSNEAKRYGIKTGEVIWQAQQKCPDLLIVPPHYEKYLEYSRKARAIYAEYTPQVEPYGLDECWLDLTGCEKLFGSGEKVAEELRERIKKELQITVSIGVSFNKSFAKLGSDMKKPDAVTLIPRERFREIIWPLPVEELIFVGPATKRKLNRRGIFTLEQLAKARPQDLRAYLGINGVKLWYTANGKEYDRVSYIGQSMPVKSIGNGITCRKDLTNEVEVRRVLMDLATQVSGRLRKHELMANSIQVSVRTESLIWQQYQMPLPLPTQAAWTFTVYAMKLFRERYRWPEKVRSLTVTAIKLSEAALYRQISFLKEQEEHDRIERLDGAMYELRQRYGKECVLFASQKLDLKLPFLRNDVITLPQSNRAPAVSG